jgi:hypothetical protein
MTTKGWQFSREITLGNVLTVVAMFTSIAVMYFDLRAMAFGALTKANEARAELNYRRERVESIPAMQAQIAKNERDVAQVFKFSNTLGRIEGRVTAVERHVSKIENILENRSGR